MLIHFYHGFYMLDFCEEYGDIIAILPIPYAEAIHATPFNVRSAFLTHSDLEILAPSKAVSPIAASVTFNNAMLREGFYVQGSEFLSARAGTIITIGKKPSIKTTSKVSASGISHTVKITCSTEEGLASLMPYINELQGAPSFDLIVVDSLHRLYLVRGTFPSCRISVSQQLPLYDRHDVSIEIENVNGIQPIM